MGGEMASKIESQGPPIECKNLWKIYGLRDKEALAAIQAEGLDKDEVRDRFGCAVGVVNATFDVNQGEIFCVMGLSGSGKSTLVRHVNRLIEPTAGQVLINGEDIGQVSEEELRQLRSERIGMVFQHMALLPHRNVRENAAFALELREVERKERFEKAEKALEMVGLDGWETYYPDELSGGMQQRVGLARAIAADPDILLMDEPFSALDPLIRRQLQDQFIELSQMMQKTTIFITHDLDEAIRLGNRIAIMNNGELVQIGTPEDIVTQPADDYVADFVAGISRLHLVFAPTIMHPIAAFRGKHPDAEVEDCPMASPDADLNHLIDIMVETEERFIRIIEENKCVGVVTRGSLLRAIQGKETS
jgi:glycine betaine/proline transport system ATP-binding protein